jgi:hypothetical protein
MAQGQDRRALTAADTRLTVGRQHETAELVGGGAARWCAVLRHGLNDGAPWDAVK